MDFFQERIQAFNESSKRARTAIYVVVVASTVTAASVWNYRPGNWESRKIQVINSALEYLGTQPGEIDLEHASEYLKAKEFVRFVKLKWERGNPETIEALRSLKKATITRYGENFGQIKVPFLGIIFNPNDTGLIGGFGLLMTLLILRFTLAREGTNLRIVLERAAQGGKLAESYELLSMGQVLTVPPEARERPNTWHVWNSVHKLLFALPLLVHTCVIIVDLQTFHVGWSICKSNTVIVLVGSAAFEAAIALLTWSCYSISLATDQCWERFKSSSIVVT